MPLRPQPATRVVHPIELHVVPSDFVIPPKTAHAEQKDMQSRAAKEQNSKGNPQVTKDENIEPFIRIRAYELYINRGGKPGNEMNDWLEAEREIKARDRIGRNREELLP